MSYSYFLLQRPIDAPHLFICIYSALFLQCVKGKIITVDF